MIEFRETKLDGCCLVVGASHTDARGTLSVRWNAEKFAERGLDARAAQLFVTKTRREHAIRGMHFQRAPHAGGKLVQCTRGSIFDVVLDLRPESPTHLQSVWCELSAGNVDAVYVPPGCAHGFQTLERWCDVLYLTGAPYRPSDESGVRWNDPAWASVVPWPGKNYLEPYYEDPSLLSERDASWPLL